MTFGEIILLNFLQDSKNPPVNGRCNQIYKLSLSLAKFRSPKESKLGSREGQLVCRARSAPGSSERQVLLCPNFDKHTRKHGTPTAKGHTSNIRFESLRQSRDAIHNHPMPLRNRNRNQHHATECGGHHARQTDQ